MDRCAAALPVVLCLSLLAPAAARASEPEAVCTSEVERQAVALVNAERAALGRPPLALDVRLNAAARRQADDMRDGCFLSHTGSDGSSPRERMTAAGYPDPMGEVAGAGSYPFPPSLVVDAWMASADHRAILTNTDARHVGMAYAALPAGCRVSPYGFWAGAFWAGTTGGAPDSEFLEDLCCPTPGGEPTCLPEAGREGGAAAGVLVLVALRAHRGRCARGSRLAAGRRTGATVGGR